VLGANAEGWGLALVLLSGAPVAAGLGAGVEGRGSGDSVAPVVSALREAA
jgi:hypothetical protein